MRKDIFRILKRACDMADDPPTSMRLACGLVLSSGVEVKDIPAPVAISIDESGYGFLQSMEAGRKQNKVVVRRFELHGQQPAVSANDTTLSQTQQNSNASRRIIDATWHLSATGLHLLILYNRSRQIFSVPFRSVLELQPSQDPTRHIPLPLQPATTQHEATITSFAVVKTSQGQPLIATGCVDGSLTIWVKSKAVVRLNEAHNGKVTVITPLYDAVATGGDDQKIRIFTLPDAECVATVNIEASEISSMIGSHLRDPTNGRFEALIAGTAEGMIFVFELGSMNLVGLSTGHDARILSISTKPDGTAIGVGYIDGTVGVHWAKPPAIPESGRHTVTGAAIACEWVDMKAGGPAKKSSEGGSLFLVWSSDGSHKSWRSPANKRHDLDPNDLRKSHDKDRAAVHEANYEPEAELQDAKHGPTIEHADPQNETDSILDTGPLPAPTGRWTSPRQISAKFLRPSRQKPGLQEGPSQSSLYDGPTFMMTPAGNIKTRARSQVDSVPTPNVPPKPCAPVGLTPESMSSRGRPRRSNMAKTSGKGRKKRTSKREFGIRSMPKYSPRPLTDSTLVIERARNSKSGSRCSGSNGLLHFRNPEKVKSLLKEGMDKREADTDETMEIRMNSTLWLQREFEEKKKETFQNAVKRDKDIQDRIKKEMREEARRNRDIATDHALNTPFRNAVYNYRNMTSVKVDEKHEMFQRAKRKVPKQVSKAWLESVRDRPSVYDYYETDPNHEPQYLPRIPQACNEIIQEVLTSDLVQLEGEIGSAQQAELETCFWMG